MSTHPAAPRRCTGWNQSPHTARDTFPDGHYLAGYCHACGLRRLEASEGRAVLNPETGTWEHHTYQQLPTPRPLDGHRPAGWATELAKLLTSRAVSRGLLEAEDRLVVADQDDRLRALGVLE